MKTTLQFFVQDTAGNPLANSIITFSVESIFLSNPEEYQTQTDESGLATLENMNISDPSAASRNRGRRR